jgi:hypothetical protein
MTESFNLAPAVAAVLHGDSVPQELCGLALLPATGVLIALFSQLGAAFE